MDLNRLGAQKLGTIFFFLFRFLVTVVSLFDLLSMGLVNKSSTKESFRDIHLTGLEIILYLIFKSMIVVIHSSI